MNKDVEVTVLGSGTRVLLAERSMAGYAVLTPSFLLLLDCGDGVIRRALEAGLPILAVDAILFSHLHLDHVADLPPLLWALHGEGRRRAHRPLQLYGPPGFGKFFTKLAGLCGDWLSDLAVPVVTREVTRTSFGIGPWQVQALPMSHGIPANGYRLELAGNVLAYTGDTGPCDEIVTLAQEADLLITECSFPNGQETATHLTPGEVGGLAARAKCRRVLLSHFYPEALQQDLAAQCAEFFGGEIELSYDLMRLKL